MRIKDKYPVVTAVNVFDVVRELGIRPWPEIRPPMSAAEYLKGATPDQVEEFNRFAPRVEVVTHANINARDDESRRFTGFRVVQKPAVCVYAEIEGYVPVTAEWKHGNGLITLVLPAGVPGKEEARLPQEQALRATAVREFREEIGVSLNEIYCLLQGGTWSTVRNSHTVFHGFYGVVNDEYEVGSAKLDESEHIAVVLFSRREWATLLYDTQTIPEEFGIEAIARDTTTLALREIGGLQLLF